MLAGLLLHFPLQFANSSQRGVYTVNVLRVELSKRTLAV